MTELNNTQRARDFVRAYNRALRNGHTGELSTAYKSHSKAKAQALDYCKRLQAELDGYNGVVVGGSTYSFSYAFEYVSKEDGTVKLAYITKGNDYAMDYIY